MSRYNLAGVEHKKTTTGKEEEKEGEEEGRREGGREGGLVGNYFHCQFAFNSLLRCSFVKFFFFSLLSPFQKTARASIKVLGEMSTTDTVVPTRFAF